MSLIPPHEERPQQSGRNGGSGRTNGSVDGDQSNKIQFTNVRYERTHVEGKETKPQNKDAVGYLETINNNDTNKNKDDNKRQQQRTEPNDKTKQTKTTKQWFFLTSDGLVIGRSLTFHLPLPTISKRGGLAGSELI
jgi:hypothetical protein